MLNFLTFNSADFFHTLLMLIHGRSPLLSFTNHQW